MDEKIAIVALQKLRGLDYSVKRRLMEAEGSIGDLFEGKGRLGKDIGKKIASFDGWKDIDRDLKKIRTWGISGIRQTANMH